MKKTVFVLLLLALGASYISGHEFEILNDRTHQNPQEHGPPERDHDQSFKCFFFVKLIVGAICEIGFRNHQFCHSAFQDLLPIYFYNLPTRWLDSQIECSKHHFCQKPQIIPLSKEKYREEVLADMPSTKPKPVSENPPISKFLIFGDAHPDPGYQEGKDGKCSLPLCCRIGDRDPRRPEDRAGKWGYLGKCDIPVYTLVDFLENQIDKIDPDFIIWMGRFSPINMLYLGDTPGHDIWEQTKDNHLDLVKLTTKILKKKYGYGKVFPVIGNHEGLPADQFNVRGSNQQWILDTLSEEWKEWLSPDSYVSFKQFGRYTQFLPNTNLRMIVLNCMVHDITNSYLYQNATDPLGQLDWLRTNLKLAEELNQVVFLIDHLPPASRYSNKEYSYRYSVLVERFSHLIMGQFFAHNHEDSFSLVKNSQQEVVGVEMEIPALSTFPYKNPGFRVYEMDLNTFNLVDYTQYRLYVQKANDNEPPNWEVAYKFRDFYGVDDMSFDSFKKIAEKLKYDKPLQYKVMYMMEEEGPLGPEWFMSRNGALWVYCLFWTSNLFEQEECTGGKFVDLAHYGFAFLNNHIMPPWELVVFEDPTNNQNDK